MGESTQFLEIHNSDGLAYGWTQSGGPVIILSSAAISQPTFTAPGTPTILTFTLSVTDSYGLPTLAPDQVIVTVIQPQAYIYLPLILRNDTLPTAIPARNERAIPLRPPSRSWRRTEWGNRSR